VLADFGMLFASLGKLAHEATGLRLSCSGMLLASMANVVSSLLQFAR
jgi:hypothetical protein